MKASELICQRTSGISRISRRGADLFSCLRIAFMLHAARKTLYLFTSWTIPPSLLLPSHLNPFPQLPTSPSLSLSSLPSSSLELLGILCNQPGSRKIQDGANKFQMHLSLLPDNISTKLNPTATLMFLGSSIPTGTSADTVQPNLKSKNNPKWWPLNFKCK